MSQTKAPAELSDKKQRLLAALQRKKRKAEPPQERGPQPRAQAGPVPLSITQEGLWFQCRERRGPALYHIPLLFRLASDFDVEHFARALRDLVARHEALRTRIEEHEGKPVQVVVPAEAVDTRPLDLGTLEPSAERAALAESCTRPFDLARAPLWRCVTAIRTDGSRVLALVLHHLIADGWSVQILLRECQERYEAHRTGRTADLAPLPIQFADFALWERQWLGEPAAQRHLAWWKAQLADAVPFELTGDRPRPAELGHRGQSLQFQLDASTTGALNQLCRREGATLFAGLLSIFQILLARYTGRTDGCLGTTVANRDRAESQGLIGCFANLLVLRADLSGNPTFADLLRRTRDRTLDAWTHQQVPFVHLIEQLRPQRDPSRTPFFQINFVLQNADEGTAPRSTRGTAAATANAPMAPMAPDEADAVALYDLSLHLRDTGRGCQGTFVFNTALYEPATVERLAQLYALLAAQAVAQPERSLRDFELETQAVREAARQRAARRKPGLDIG